MRIGGWHQTGVDMVRPHRLPQQLNARPGGRHGGLQCVHQCLSDCTEAGGTAATSSNATLTQASICWLPMVRNAAKPTAAETICPATGTIFAEYLTIAFMPARFSSRATRSRV